MYAVTVESRKTHLRTVYLCGCYDVIAKLITLGKQDGVSFRTSSFREIPLDVASGINKHRPDWEQDLVDRVNEELSATGWI